jgi:hypothetical protein
MRSSPASSRWRRGGAGREQDLPIARHDDLRVREINSRLPTLSGVDLGRVEAYERKHKERKTVLQKIESLRNAATEVRGDGRDAGPAGPARRAA